MKGNSVVPDMPRVMLGKGKRVNTRGSEALVTWGVQFNRETLLEDTKDFHGWITFTVEVVPFAYFSLVLSEVAPLTVKDRAVSGCSEKGNEDQKTAGCRWREIHLF